MSKKMISCKACGEEMPKKVKRCPKCGAKNKKPVYKKLWFWLIVFAILGAIGSGGSETETAPIVTTPPTTQVPTTEPMTEPTIAPTEVVTTEPTSEQETLSSSDAAELVISMIELTASKDFDYSNVEGDETGITISLANDGVVQELTIAKYSGHDENYEPWVEAKTNFISLCNTIYDTAVEFGMNDPAITLNILNDQNHDNILLMIMNGTVVYDVMSD